MTRLHSLLLASYTKFMANLSRLAFVITTVLFFGVQARAQEETQEIKSLRNYQIQSQYGAESAVLNPIFPKDSQFELSLGANYSPSSSLYDYAGVSAGAIYHFNRRHAIEPILVQYNFGELSSFAITQIADKVDGAKKAQLGVDLPRMIVSSNYIFTPYYSKMHLTDLAIAHMDFYALVGIAGVYTESLKLDNALGETNWRVGGNLGLGLRVLMRSRYGVRFEVRDFIHTANQLGANELTNDIQASLSLSIFLDSFPDYTQM